MNKEQRGFQGLAALEPPKATALRSLTLKRQLFVRHYLSNGFNGAKAARDAGYAAASADREASRLLGFAGVQAAISAVLDSEGLADPRVLRAFVRQELIKSARDGKPAERMKALELLGRSVGFFDPSRQQPQQHLHLHGQELSRAERDALLRLQRQRTIEGEHRALED